MFVQIYHVQIDLYTCTPVIRVTGTEHELVGSLVHLHSVVTERALYHLIIS